MVRNKNLLTHRTRDTETLKHIFHYVTTSASTRKQQRYLFVQPYACLPFLPEADFCPRPHAITSQPLNNQYPTETSIAFVHFKTERFHSTSSYHTDSQDVPETPRVNYSFSFLSVVTNSQAQPRTEAFRNGPLYKPSGRHCSSIPLPQRQHIPRFADVATNPLFTPSERVAER